MQLKLNPLKVRLEILTGTPFGHQIFLSEDIQRPNNTRHDKKYVTTSNATCAVYATRKERDQLFVDDYVYLTLEAARDINYEIRYVFGKNTSFRTSEEPEAQSVKSKRFVQIRSLKALVDDQIKVILGNTNLLRECRRQASAVLRKRKERYEHGSLFVTDNPDRRQYSRVLSPGHAMQVELEARQRIMSAKNDQRDDKRRMQLFLHSHSWGINKMHEKLIEQKRGELRRLKTSINTWVGIIKLIKMGKVIGEKFKAYKKIKCEEEAERLRYLRIFIFYASRVKALGGTFEERVNLRIIQ